MAKWLGDFKYSMVSFDDVLLRPQFHSGESRAKCTNVSTRLTTNFYIDIPVGTTNMATITGPRMLKTMSRLGSFGLLHRRGSVADIKRMMEEIKTDRDKISPLCVSVGVNNYKELFELYKSFSVDIITVDVAHADSQRVLDVLKYIKDKDFSGDVICGNVSTAEGTRLLCENGTNAVKINQGAGSLCTTRLVTGHGVPQLQAIKECAEVARQFNVPIIADGAVKTSGDIVKCFAAGADSLVTGSLVAGCFETPGLLYTDMCEFPYDPGEKPRSDLFKRYSGMASMDSMVGWRDNANEIAPEGESTLVEYNGKVEYIIKNLVAGIRSGLTYSGCSTIRELQEKAIFQRVSPSVLVENRPHKLS